ncbi:putative cysteine synthase [Helianthus debilis subsp. tardiflorus]
MVLVEATSGNTGIGLAFIEAMKGYKLKIVLPLTYNMERRIVMRFFGSELRITDVSKEGIFKNVDEILEETPNSYFLKQFDNPANPQVCLCYM